MSALQETAQIEKILSKQKAYFYAQNTKSLPFRIKQLDKIKKRHQITRKNHYSSFSKRSK